MIITEIQILQIFEYYQAQIWEQNSLLHKRCKCSRFPTHRMKTHEEHFLSIALHIFFFVINIYEILIFNLYILHTFSYFALFYLI